MQRPRQALGNRFSPSTTRLSHWVSILNWILFAALLNQLEAATHSSRRICILTQYVATVFYLASEIELHGMPSRLLNGNMAAEERQRSIELFVSAGGVLTATSAILSEGVVLPRGNGSCTLRHPRQQH